MLQDTYSGTWTTSDPTWLPKDCEYPYLAGALAKHIAKQKTQQKHTWMIDTQTSCSLHPYTWSALESCQGVTGLSGLGAFSVPMTLRREWRPQSFGESTSVLIWAVDCS
ncbi:uncharacterized protein LOC144287905 [Canis aureus]